MPMATKTKKPAHNGVRTTFIRIAKIQVLIGLILGIQIIVYDAGKLITPDVVLKRWSITALMVLTAAVCWYLARINNKPNVIRNLVWILISVDLIVASFSVYTQRGMASRAVLLFVIPILTAAALQRKGAIYLTSLVAVLVYIVTAVAYFVLNFNEGYKLELYGEIGFYSAILLCVGGISWALVRNKH